MGRFVQVYCDDILIFFLSPGGTLPSAGARGEIFKLSLGHYGSGFKSRRVGGPTVTSPAASH